MAFVLLPPSPETKGILLLTHKEFFLFQAAFQSPLLPSARIPHRIRQVVGWPKDICTRPIRRFVTSSLDSLSNHYFIGIHWGFRLFTPIKLPSYISFSQGEPGIVNITSSQPFLPYSAAAFIPDHFLHPTPLPPEKIFDFCLLSRDTPFKRIPAFIDGLKALHNQRPKEDFPRVLIIVTEWEPNGSSGCPLEQYLHHHLTTEQRNQISLVRLSRGSTYPGIEPKLLSILLSSSRVAALYSEYEGHSKFIREAYTTGCHIVLDEANLHSYSSLDQSVVHTFKTLSSSHIALQEALRESYNHSLPISTRAKNTYSYNYPTYKTLLAQLLDPQLLQRSASEWYGGDLSKALPAHSWDSETFPWIPLEKGLHSPSDITMYREFCAFIRHLRTPYEAPCQ